MTRIEIVALYVTHPVATSQTLIVLSRDAVNRKSPAGTNAKDDTL